jgi:hypothetical protein
MAAGPETLRPGRSYYVPEVRVCLLGALRAGPESGDVLTDLQGDLLRVEVTRVASGVSQYQLTLNNWFHSLPRERGGPAPAGPAVAEKKLLQPRHKYNHFELLRFGRRLRIDMRYWPDPVSELADPAGATKGWVPMIAGPITDMKFTFASGEGARLTVVGEDDLRPLRNKLKKKAQFKSKNELDIVSTVFKDQGYPLPIAPSKVARPGFLTGRGVSEAIEAKQSPLEWVQKVADRYDLEYFVEFATLSAETPPAQEFHLEPARSRLPPDRTLRDIHILEREKQLVDFSPTLKLADQYTSAAVKGKHRIPTLPDGIAADVIGTILEDELHRDGKDPKLTSAPEVRKRLFPGEENPLVDDENPNLDEERARVRAEALLRRKAREFLKIQASTLGLPRLRPGFHVEIRGYRPPFDGFYYVERTVHTWGADGLRTQITGRRPGMPLPEDYQEM